MTHCTLILSIMALVDIVLLIPQSTSDRHHRRTLSHAVTFEEALEIMYDVIGCSDVHQKPNLAYKLASAPSKADPITLGSAEDWKGCLEDVAQIQAKKKATVQVKIIVSEQVRCVFFMTNVTCDFDWLCF